MDRRPLLRMLLAGAVSIAASHVPAGRLPAADPGVAAEEICPVRFGILDYGPDAGRFPRVIVPADMNNDGQTDLVTGNRDFGGRSEVAVVLGAGDRTFRVEGYEAGEELQSLAAADLDADGDVDVATVNEDRVLILENSGTGGLAAPAPIATDTRTRALAIADLDADGLPDLLTASQTTDRVASYRNLGGLGFGNARAAAAPGRPAAVLPVDLDNDGRPEVIVADGSGGRLLVFQAGPTGGLVAGSEYPVDGNTPATLDASDLDADGAIDIAVRMDEAIAILRGTGTGTLLAPNVLRLSASSSTGVVIADVNRDSVPDLITARAGPNEAVVYTGDGAAGFEPQHFDLWVVPRGIAATDLDQDGDPELAFSGISFENIAILWGDEPHFTEPPRFDRRDVALGARPHGATLGDFNGDGLQDVVTAGGDDITITVALSADGTPLARRTSMIIPGTGRTFGAATADFDADGDIDFAVGDNEVNVVGVVLNQGEGTFERGVTYQGVFRPFRIIAADITGDGPPDLITADSIANQLSLLRNKGDGTFEAPQPIPVGSQPLAAVAADVTGDGQLELVSANSVSNDISILVREGDSFTTHSLLFLVGQPRDLLASDLDSDGTLDLATANGVTEDVNVFLNNGAATFDPPLAFRTGQPPYSLMVGDLDSDGRPDLATGNVNSDTVSLLLGRGAGSYHVPFRYNVGREPRFVMISDFDLDGDTDVVTANRQSRDLSFLSTEAPPNAPFRRADVDGDGRYTLLDALRILRTLVGPDSLSCLSAADSNDDGAVDLSDALYITNQLFLRGPPPPPPSEGCGADPTADELTCAAHPCGG